MRDNKGGRAKGGRGRSNNSCLELNGKELNYKSIMKEVEFLAASDMTWKERKDLQNKKVVSLGGKAPKKQRLPLSVARVMMKNQKAREQKILEQELLCAHYGEKPVKTTKQATEKRRPLDPVLKSSAGRFRNGVLDVKHLLKPTPLPRDEDNGPSAPSKGGKKKKMKKKGAKKNSGKRKGGGRKRH